MTRSFFRDSAAAVVVYDICDPMSLANVRGWVDDFRVRGIDVLTARVFPFHVVRWDSICRSNAPTLTL